MYFWANNKNPDIYHQHFLLVFKTPSIKIYMYTLYTRFLNASTESC